MRFKLFVALIGAVIVFKGWQEWKLAAIAKPTPASMTLAELSENGPGDNAHLVVGDFFLCSWDYVYSSYRGRWDEAWVPAVPLGGVLHQQILNGLDENGNWPEDQKMPVPEHVDVVFRLTSARNENDVDRIAMEDTLQGLVVSEIEDLDLEEKNLLQESYPGIDFEAVQIFEPGRRPKGVAAVYGMLGGGGVLGLGALAMLVPWRRGKRREDEVEGEFGDREQDTFA